MSHHVGLGEWDSWSRPTPLRRLQETPLVEKDVIGRIYPAASHHPRVSDTFWQQFLMESMASQEEVKVDTPSPDLKNRESAAARSCARKEGSSSSLEDMTLEDFLVKAGKIATNTSIIHAISLDSLSETELLPSPSIDELLDVPLRFRSGDIEKTTERRLRRKIQNRESVACSRARKQAYLVELETRVSHLEEENSKLREEKAKQCTTADASSKKEGKTQREKTKIGDGLNLEDLEPHFGKRLEDVAKELHVGRSTIKRACRNYGIIRWPCNKKHKNNPTNEISCRGSQQNMHPSTSSKNVTIKVKFEDDTIKFDFCLSSGIEKLLNEVGKRLNLKVGCFKLKYLDEDDDDILLACDDDLQFYLNSLSIVVEKTCIKLFVNLIHR